MAKEEFKFQPNASDTLYIEDGIRISLEAFEVIEKGLRKHGAVMTNDQEDHIYAVIEREIERFGNGNCRTNTKTEFIKETGAIRDYLPRM